LFSVTDRPAELYYRSAQGILALAKETDPKLFNMACGIAVKYDRCSYKFISNLVKSRCQGYLALQDGDMQTENIAPTIHSNIRGPQAFK
jgi:hypothetical protein